METNKQINSVEKHKTPEPKMCQTEQNPNSLKVKWLDGKSNGAITFGYQKKKKHIITEIGIIIH